MKRLLLMVPDLMFGTRIEDTARALGYEVQNVAPNADFRMVVDEARPELVVLTFDRTGDAWEKLASTAHAKGISVLAFGSHMNVDAFKRARELGCDQVVANSRMSAEMSKLLA